MAAPGDLYFRSGPELGVAGMRRILHDALKGVDLQEEGREAYAMIEALYPICRSITGNGVRQSLRLLQGTFPWKCARFQPALRCSTGLFRKNGISAMPTLRMTRATA